MKRELHPRPQFIREKWELLDGEWDFCFDEQNRGLKESWSKGIPSDKKIKVPYTYETKLSNIDIQTPHNVIWYQKNVVFNKEDKITINFEGADFHTTVWLNGVKVGQNIGGYHRFSFDLDDYIIDGNNSIIVRCEDSLDTNQVRGKQRWLNNSFRCWYVQSTGIWKSVWIEYRNSNVYLSSVKMKPEIDNDHLIIQPTISGNNSIIKENDYFIEVDIYFEEELITNCCVLINHQEQEIILDTRVKRDSNWGTKIWTIETPNLYDIRFKLLDNQTKILDEVNSYFGMRKISIEGDRILLNNRELYQKLILDQGYWPESGLTPPSVRALENDLEKVKSLGYNGVRKHQKIEDERFLYLCDKLGILVWIEMPSNYQFSDLSIKNFTEEWIKIVTQNFNHPSVITWVPFNESWGIKNIFKDKQQQSFTEGIYYLTKSIDPDRPVITNDGWEHTISDIITLHDYEEFSEMLKHRYKEKSLILDNRIQFNKDKFAFANGYKYMGQPIIISEFGGIAFATENEDQWGYGTHVKNEEDFIERFNNIHEAIFELEYVTGYCYTQLTDVEQEVNGLLDINRKPKVSTDLISNVNKLK
ncbi:glycoside hydrolase family 2 [Globicatella sp. HMSC072A10]|uniref:glycoside hydrolase family 2 protein n=1 Tax=Globicatella sp. HMSC072A10 TaxID=1739315 RepID=UPI0008CA15B6|nr:glycoside hydrolase family 2 [Globicatella sp. HMSC072A10]OFK53073.1 glycoside hydrolase family 2 [Globicatella sp. HMSC072A10]